jgi:radical SAM superfamily enzyme YgiQ (UPF0313 family)
MTDNCTTDACNVLLVFPGFNANSFWNYQATCEIVGAKYPGAPLGLITVAAMLPRHWSIKLVNRNTEDLDEADLEWADMVMTGGMMPQQWDTLALIELAHAHGKVVVVGGPGITSTPAPYHAADFKVLGEAEGLMDRFVADWRAGARAGTYEGVRFKADVTAAPIPRWDLLKFDQYLHVGVQFSRGCPFTCEFCDIIELYGRVPRTKTAPQVISELDSLYALGYRGHVDFVDDNLIGNKKAVKAFLPHLKAWQEKHHYPFEFSTEASVNLADDDELLGLMRDASFFAVFIGIESPDTETLIKMQKKQNTRRVLSESIRHIYDAGIFVMGGFIVGFDTETDAVAGPIVKLIEDAAIPIAMVGLLYALPNTQLTRRLEQEGRLFEPENGDIQGDQCTAGLNFVMLRARRDALTDYRTVLDSIFSPVAYFDRVRDVGLSLKMPKRSLRVALGGTFREFGRFLRLITRVTLHRPDMRVQAWRTLVTILLRNPTAVTSAMRLTAFYVHLGPFSRFVVGRIDAQIEAIDIGRWIQPPLVSLPAAAEPLVAKLVA